MIIGISGKKQSGKNTVALIWQLLDVWYNTKEKTNFDRMMSDIQYVEYMLEDDKISYNKSSWQQKSFAHKLKQITCILLGCTMEQLEDSEFKEKELGEGWWYYKGRNNSLIPYNKNSKRSKEDLIKLTPRKLLQIMGTQIGRQIIHPDIWVNALMSEYIHFTTTGGIGKSAKLKEKSNWIITDVRFTNEAEAIKDRGGILIRVNRDSDFKDNHVSENELNTYKDWNYVIDNNYSLLELILRVREIMFKEGIIYE